jgi:hypothetical protein
MFPAELRLKIWKMALPGPRIVEIYLNIATDRRTGVKGEQVLRVNTPPPALMHVNWESRRAALEKYWLQLGNEEIKNFFAQIDPTEDTIFIPWTLSDPGSLVDRLINGAAWSEEAKQSVRLMAVDERTWRELHGPKGFIYFENLERYTIVAHDLNDGCWEGWRQRDTDLSFVDLDDEEIVHDRYSSVRDQMSFENGYYNRQWKLPVIEVKVAARGGKKCCYN